jgi:hypothetical protein
MKRNANKRLPILLTEDEYNVIKEESQIRGISMGELVRYALEKEILGQAPGDKARAIRILSGKDKR